MFHAQILAGLIWGTVRACESGIGAVCEFWIYVIGTCAAFYILFLCRMLGAGDIKVMALCVGVLGIGDGLMVIFLGLMFAAVHGARRLGKQGILWEKMGRLMEFALVSGRDGKLRAYSGREDAESLLRLGPYLWAGYCVYLLAVV